METYQENIRPKVLDLLERASSQEAAEGLNDEHIMTPKRVKEVIDASGVGGNITVNNVIRAGGLKGKFISNGITDKFTIPELSGEKEVELVMKNLCLVEGEDYIVDKTKKEIKLNFGMREGEEIHWNLFTLVKTEVLIELINTLQMEVEQLKAQLNK